MKKLLIFCCACAWFVMLPAQNLPDAVVMGDGVRLRKSDALDGAVVGSVNRGDLVEILDAGRLMDFIDGKATYGTGYRWYQIRTDNGVEGWMYGKYLYKIQDLGNDHRLWTSGATFSMHAAHCEWLESDEEPDGPDFQETHSIPLILDDKGKGYLILEEDAPLSWENNSGEGSSIGYFWRNYEQHHPGEYILKIDTGYQEGGQESFYYLRQDGNVFRVVYSWRTGSMGG